MFSINKEREKQRKREKGKKKDEQRVWVQNSVDWNWWQNPLCVGRTFFPFSYSFNPFMNYINKRGEWFWILYEK